jgi:hypothetical protein
MVVIDVPNPHPAVANSAPLLLGKHAVNLRLADSIALTQLLVVQRLWVGTPLLSTAPVNLIPVFITPALGPRVVARGAYGLSLGAWGEATLYADHQLPAGVPRAASSQFIMVVLAW